MTPADRTDILLKLATVLRHLTTANVVTATGLPYETAKRALQRCASARPPLLDAIIRPNPRGKGRSRTIYVLAPAGATRLLSLSAAFDAAELDRQVRSGAKQRRRMHSERTIHPDHSLMIGSVQAMLISYTLRLDPATRIVWADRDPEFRVELPGGHGQAARSAIYVPDFVLAFEWSRGIADGERVVDIVIGEIETGKGSKNEEKVAIQKGPRLFAFIRSFRSNPALAGLRISSSSMLTTIVCTDTRANAERFTRGLTSVSPHGWKGLRIASEEELLLSPRPKTDKRRFRDVCAGITQLLAEPLFRVPSCPELLPLFPNFVEEYAEKVARAAEKALRAQQRREEEERRAEEKRRAEEVARNEAIMAEAARGHAEAAPEATESIESGFRPEFSHPQQLDLRDAMSGL